MNTTFKSPQSAITDVIDVSNIGLPRGLDAQTPLLMLPVNIETRFMSSGDTNELWVRIYPDQIAINSHEPELTIQEIADGQSYWNTVWAAGLPSPTLDAVQAPWRGLASLYGAPRAAWIALQMTPTNLSSQPTASTPAGSTPTPTPIFPTPPTRDSSWQKTAFAAALPDAWTVVLVSETTNSTFRSGPVTPDLAVGLTPGAGSFPPGSPVDANLQWLVDFNQALAAGMALKIPLTPEQRSTGFDQVFVYGLRSKGNAAEFSNLIEAHHYTDGFALVPQGSPTNNTTDASSAFSRKDPTFDISFAVERQDSLDAASNSDGNIFASLLGLDPKILAHVQYADGIDQQSSADSVTALWPSTLGYFLSQMMSNVFSVDQIEDARQYVLANVSPRGTIPAFRTGQTPYGVLPVTSLKRYKPTQTRTAAPSIEAPLVDCIQRLWPVWLQSSATAPHMQNSGDPDQQLTSVLGMDASSMAFRGRTVLGDDFLWNYLNLLRTPTTTEQSWWTSHLVAGRQALNYFGYNTWDPRLIHLGMAPTNFPIPFPTVQTPPLSETDPLANDADLGGGVKANYIEWLRRAAIDDIRAENYPGPKPTSLLYKILRQSVLLDYVTLATNTELLTGRVIASQLRETEIVGIPPAQPAPQPPVSPWEILARPSEPNPALTWAQYLVAVDPTPESPYARLTDLRNSLDRLAKLPTAELDRLLTEFLDSCSHRLDVWASAVANALLARTRHNQVNDIHLGAFGWVEQVHASAVGIPIQGPELASVQSTDRLRSQRINATSVLPTPIQPATDNGGFIFAPSFEQARTAAILRNGYMTHKGTADEGLLSLDISSDRVRKALYLLDGVRQGQSLSALLGYLFENGLHDLNLDKYTQPFRDLFPVVANQLTPSSNPSESVAASNVVDGVALAAAFEKGTFDAGGNWGAGLPPAGSDQTSVLTLLKTIDDYSDALGDISIAEAVFQIVRGNYGRAGGLMDAISKGDRPPDPDIVTTPRGGLDLTHRVNLLFAGAPTYAASWSAVTKHPRALAEPALDSWLSQILPNPAQVACTVKYELAGLSHTSTVHLSDLEVGPLDCLSMADSAEVPQQSELESRILQFALPAGASSQQIDYTAPVANIAFPDFFFLVASLQSLIGSSRALTPQDLTVPEKKAEDLGGAVDLTNLQTRASAAALQLSNAVAALTTAIGGGSASAIRTALQTCSFFGVPGSVPSSIGNSALADQAAAVLKTLQPRSTQASSVNIPTATQADILTVFSSVFGANFTILPRFTPPDAANLQSAFTQSASLVASDPVAPSRWLNQLTHIRPAISKLDTVLSLAQILSGNTSTPQPLLGQLPLQAGDRWLGLPIDPSNPPNKGRVAFACITQGDPTTQTPYAGLLFDEWPERIPSTDERAAVAFHYERPKARAPQTLLLAVCPDNRATWDDDLVTGTIQEALELAKIRTVDLDSVLRVGQILPALYFALNLQGATVSTNFTRFDETSLHATSILR
ncbi:hypothetical protein [Tunturiibacter lichenicola]|uniref:hypothetical protein n=1 Tax=Tunturiibacter lichenicola TaxID=2051959 RepID=UPI0021B1C7AC|nr:hypothetical protein [Edaphobacter lichenicola]